MSRLENAQPRLARLDLLLFALIGLIVIQGCAKNIELTSVMTGAQANLTPQEADRLWSVALEETVDARGRIDFSKTAQNPDRLRSYVAYIARTAPHNRPELFPDSNSRMAYYINSYNALAMYGAVDLKVEDGFESLIDRAKFFKYTRYAIGDKWISLLDYENDVIRPLGDPRVHFALNCMVVGCPRLPQTPFRADILDKQLERAAREFLNHTRNVRIEKKTNTVHLSEILDFYTEDFTGQKNTPSLISYVNRYRKIPIPKHYDIEFIPYDWTLNRQ